MSIVRGGQRTGITLLEVLISIGVLAIGVLGAASLLPMATYFQGETTKYDRGGALAHQAVHDLQIKDYLSPRRWIFIDPTNSSPPLSPEGILGLTGTLASPNPNYNPLSAFVIDPLGFSYVAAMAQNNTAVTFPCYFPAFPNQSPSPPGGGPFIYRAGITANDYWPPAATAPLTSPILMSFSVADRMMRSSDDVLFEYDPASLRQMKQALGQPTDFDSRPLAITNTGINAPSAYAPNSAGDFSWIATVSRTPSDMLSGPGISASLHRFQVSVVVLQKRDLTLWSAGLTPEQPPSERQVFALFTQYGGQVGTTQQVTSPFYGGGGLQLYVYEGTTTTPGQPSRHWLDNIKPNTYLMLTANFQDLTTGTIYPQLAWYRIVTVDSGPNRDPQNASRWYRNVSVAGGDWPGMWFQWTNGSGTPYTGTATQLWFGADPTAPDAMMPFNQGTAGTPNRVPVAFCALMDDSIAEYDATITLDYSLVRQ
ncbi:MAG TPA: hypothetical protein VG826_20450 [Pirellulales bacterium]|nr:hypothetical protein [Pirellulales bacterium]